MATNWVRPYLLNDGPPNVVVPNAILELERRMEGARETYVVKGNPPTPAWAGCWLVPRGSVDFQWPEKQLKKWESKHEYTYDKLIKRALRSTDADTVRLEGEITVNNKKELVVLFQAPNVVVNPDGSQDGILIVRSVMKSLFDLTLDQDGTGHGNPR